MTSEAWFLVLSGALWVVIVAGWAWWIRARLVRRRRLVSWSRASAQVTRAWASDERVTIDSQTQRYRVFHGEYAFTDRAGRTQRGKHQSRRPLSSGDQVEVMYDPAEPTTHEPIDRALPLWGPLFFLALFTLGVGLFAVITLALGLGAD